MTRRAALLEPREHVMHACALCSACGGAGCTAQRRASLLSHTYAAAHCRGRSLSEHQTRLDRRNRRNRAQAPTTGSEVPRVQGCEAAACRGNIKPHAVQRGRGRHRSPRSSGSLHALLVPCAISVRSRCDFGTVDGVSLRMLRNRREMRCAALRRCLTLLRRWAMRSLVLVVIRVRCLPPLTFPASTQHRAQMNASLERRTRAGAPSRAAASARPLCEAAPRAAAAPSSSHCSHTPPEALAAPAAAAAAPPRETPSRAPRCDPAHIPLVRDRS